MDVVGSSGWVHRKPPCTHGAYTDFGKYGGKTEEDRGREGGVKENK